MASCGRSPWASPQNEFQRDPCPAAAVPPISSLSALLLLEVLLPPSLAPPWSSTLFTLQRRVNSHSTTVCYQPGTRREQETIGSVKTLLQLIAAAAAARHRVSQRCCSSTDWKKLNTKKTQPSTTGDLSHPGLGSCSSLRTYLLTWRNQETPRSENQKPHPHL